MKERIPGRKVNPKPALFSQIPLTEHLDISIPTNKVNLSLFSSPLDSVVPFSEFFNNMLFMLSVFPLVIYLFDSEKFSFYTQLTSPLFVSICYNKH